MLYGPVEAGTGKPRTDRFFVLGLAVMTLIVAYAASRWEVVSRARFAYEQGTRYERWMAHPDEKKASFDAELASGRIGRGDYERKMEDSDLKKAGMGYETAVDLFQPPASRWVKMSEERLNVLKPLKAAWIKSLGLDVPDDSP